MIEKCKYQPYRTALEACATISDRHWATIKSHLKIRHFERGETIIEKGQTENYLSVVAKGCVRFFVYKDDNEINFEFSFENEFSSSYASFLSRSPSLISSGAVEDVTLISIHHDRLQMLYESSAASERIGRLSIAENYIWIEKRVIQLLTSTPEERYLDLLSQYPEYIQRIPQKYLASYLQVKPESLSRIKRKIHSKKERT